MNKKQWKKLLKEALKISKEDDKIDEQLSALDLLIEDIITPEKAQEMIDNELTPGHLNLLRFPRFRETIKKIATK
jgi:hypothetical protein